MNLSNPWPLVENPFDNRTRRNRKRMHKIATDHGDKLSGRAEEGGIFSTLWADWQEPWGTWSQAYAKWVNDGAAWKSCTRKLEGKLAELAQKGPADGSRSLIDVWESAVASLYGRESGDYEFYFPRGRVPFTKGTREEIILAVHTLNDRLAGKVAGLQTAQAALEGQVAALVSANVPVPASLQAELDTAVLRTTTIQQLAVKTGEFFLALTAARTEQQGCEGAVAGTGSELNKQRVRLARRLLKNFHLLAAHHCEVDATGENPQFAAANYFDLHTLLAPADAGTPDDPPAPDPAPPPAP